MKEEEKGNLYNCITGITMNEFLYLENISKIIISYSGSDAVKGMMILKKICPL